ncbi:hypothetical protein EAF04_003785 [Stromatinia cepivora]|nr:hypothetical protein EAF04_003785 [Stromatinia cepivora]
MILEGQQLNHHLLNHHYTISLPFTIYLSTSFPHIKTPSAKTLLLPHSPLSNRSIQHLNYKLPILVRTTTAKMCTHYIVYKSCNKHYDTKVVECAHFKATGVCPTGPINKTPSHNAGEPCTSGCPS